MRTFPGWSQRLTRSHSCSRAPSTLDLHRTHACRLHDKGVDLKRRPPKSLPAAPLSKNASSKPVSIEEAARRDSAVHVSLSSDSPVKQPGTKAVPPSGEPESRRSLGLPIGIGSLVTDISEVLRGRAVAPRRRRAEWAVYRPRPAPMSTPRGTKIPPARVPSRPGNSHLRKQYRGFSRHRKGRRRRTAATFLRPSCHRCGRCHFGGNCVDVRAAA